MALLKVIKYEGDNTTFVWKYPKTDFNTMSQLIVHENQEAVFYKNGQALDLFEAGRYTLNTDNIPILRSIMSIPTGGKTPFHCEIYFINKTHQMAIKWGTDSQIQYMDPQYHFPLQIGVSGEMTLAVSDSRRLLIKLVGTEKELNQQNLVAKFRALLNSRVKTYIGNEMQTASYSIFEVDSHMEEFSNALKKKLSPDFEEYGISLVNFYVTNVAKPDGEAAYEKYKDIHIRQYSDVAEARLRQQTDIIDAETEARKKVIESQAIATKRAQEGYTYQQEKAFDVAEKISENEAVGEYTNMGVGIGTMVGVGGSIGSMVGGMVGNAVQNLNANNVGASPMADPLNEFRQKLEKLKMMKDMDMLTDEEYASAKAELTKELMN